PPPPLPSFPTRRSSDLAAGRLYLVHPDGGAPQPFGNYSTAIGPESYIAMAPGLDVPGAGCRFEAGEVYALELGTPPQAIVRVTVDRKSTRLNSSHVAIS